MTSPETFNCYQHKDPGLSPKSTRLAFKAVIYHGPGHQENQWIRVGADASKQWDVLWLKTDWDEAITPLVWIAKGQLRGQPLYRTLVKAWFQGAKEHEDATEPPYDEPIDSAHALLDSDQLWTIAEEVWSDEDEA